MNLNLSELRERATLMHLNGSLMYLIGSTKAYHPFQVRLMKVQTLRTSIVSYESESRSPLHPSYSPIRVVRPEVKRSTL